jgi:hypothetical protein
MLSLAHARLTRLLEARNDSTRSIAAVMSAVDPKRPTRTVDYNEFRCPWMSVRTAICSGASV